MTDLKTACEGRKSCSEKVYCVHPELKVKKYCSSHSRRSLLSLSLPPLAPLHIAPSSVPATAPFCPRRRRPLLPHPSCSHVRAVGNVRGGL